MPRLFDSQGGTATTGGYAAAKPPAYLKKGSKKSGKQSKRDCGKK